MCTNGQLDNSDGVFAPYRLICVFIRLPGVIYTIEIDPGTEEVIHWEWQKM